ncbi:unnamed protein product, partial [Staurois parvus]
YVILHTGLITYLICLFLFDFNFDINLVIILKYTNISTWTLNREHKYTRLYSHTVWRYFFLPDHGEGWCDLPVWNPGNTEDGDISLAGSHDWIHLPDDGGGWCDLPVWNPGNTEDGDISLVGS